MARFNLHSNSPSKLLGATAARDRVDPGGGRQALFVVDRDLCAVEEGGHVIPPVADHQDVPTNEVRTSLDRDCGLGAGRDGRVHKRPLRPVRGQPIFAAIEANLEPVFAPQREPTTLGARAVGDGCPGGALGGDGGDDRPGADQRGLAYA